MKNGTITFAEWLHSTPLHQRNLANAFKAGELARLGLLYSVPAPPDKRQWRPVVDDSIHLVRGLPTLGEVKPQITNGITTIVCTITTCRRLEVHHDNLYKPQCKHLPNTGDKKTKPKKTTSQKTIAQLLEDLL